MQISKEKCESIAKKHNIKFEHLIGRTEFYVGSRIDQKLLLDLHTLSEESITTIILRNSIVVVIDYTSDLIFKTNIN